MDRDFSNGAAHPVAIALANIKQSIDFIINTPDIVLSPSLTKKILDLQIELTTITPKEEQI